MNSTLMNKDGAAMSGYTKGPWHVDYGTKYARIKNSDGWYVMEPSSFHSTVRHRADAYLIAAAPDLYEALKALRSLLWDEGYSDQTLAMARADAAIAKAEGK